MNKAYLRAYFEGYMAKQAEASPAVPKKDDVTVVPDPTYPPLTKGGDKEAIITDKATGKPIGKYVPDKK
jgi:hypothetical protein